MARTAQFRRPLPMLKRTGRRRTPRPPRDTGPDFWTRQVVAARFGNRCVRCGRSGVTIQHRKPRGMGGSKDPAINQPSNLLWVCGNGTTGCHGHMESRRTEAYEHGWLLADRADPTATAVHLWDGRRVLLDNTGGYRPAPDTP